MLHKEKNKVYLVTLYDSSVTTFDDTPWHRPDSDERESVAICDQLSICARHLAHLHSNMVLHRDPQAKNIGHREDIRSDVAVDLETALSIAEANLSSDFIITLLVSEHLFFFQSLVRRGYTQNYSPVDRYMHYVENFIEPYEATLLANAPDDENIRRFFRNAFEQINEEIMSLSLSLVRDTDIDNDPLENLELFDPDRRVSTIYFDDKQ